MKEPNLYDNMEFVSCPVCEFQSTKNPDIIAPGFQYGFDFEYKYSKCSQCNTYYQNPRVNPKHISSFYTKIYYTNPNLRGHLERKLRNIKWALEMRWGYRVPKIKGRLLDYGAGSGEYLSKLYQYGWDDLWGYDPSPESFITKEETVSRIYENDLFPVSDQLKGSFDYIHSFHSLEHVPNPTKVLDAWYQLLKPGGKIIIATPNIASFFSRLFNRYWYYLTAPLHYVLFTSKSLEKVLQNVGFEIDHVKYRSTSQCLWGSLDFLLHSMQNNYSKPANMFLNKRLILMLLGKPLMLLLDTINEGDTLVIIAKKPS